MKSKTLLLVLLGCIAFRSVYGVAADTSSHLHQAIADVKKLKNFKYDYLMEVHFPNGDKDILKGTAYFNMTDEIYFNECPKFTMVYTPHWFFEANHQDKTVVVIDLDRAVNKKMRKALQQQMFQGLALNSFLDSFMAKSATVKAFRIDGNLRRTTMGFPASSMIREVDVSYNMSEGILSSFQAVMMQPWQRTSRGMQSVEQKMRFDHFRKVTDKSAYDKDSFFSCEKGKVKLKKYDHYKLLPTT